VDTATIQKRTIGTLMAANAFGYAGFVAVIAVTSLLASEMVGDRLAGIPAAAGTIGTALAAAPLAQRSKRRGRRAGLTLGYVIGAAGCVLAFSAGQAGVFWLLLLAMFVLGMGNTSNLQNRFAAADLADEHKTARSIALVVWVGTLGAVLGPPAALWANRVGVGFGAVDWVTPMLLGLVGFTLSAVVITTLLRPDPLEVAGGVDPSAVTENPIKGANVAMKAIWPNSHARLALLAMAVSQMAMVAVMTMTPLHMKDHGHAEMSTLVIAVHVMGMFGLAPLIGRWADRFGRVRSVQVGALILAVGTVSAVVAGYVPALVFVGLFLLGLGWSVALIAGSALLTESLHESVRVRSQGFADVTMSLFGAIAAFSSGFVKDMVGYHWLANFATIAAVLIFLGAARVRTMRAEALA
jgi:MFS family permease